MPVENIYETSRRLTGWMIPPNRIQALPDWTKTLVLGQMFWKWFAMLLILALAPLIEFLAAVHRIDHVAVVVDMPIRQ